MKKNLYLITMLMGLLMLGSCKKDNSVAEFSIDPENQTVIISYEAQEGTIPFKSSVAWSAESDADWLTVSPASGDGSGDVQTVGYKVSENNTTAERTANVTVKAGDHSIVVKVIQKCANYFKIDDTVYPVSDLKAYLSDNGQIWFYLVSGGLYFEKEDGEDEYYMLGVGNYLDIDFGIKDGVLNQDDPTYCWAYLDYDVEDDSDSEEINFSLDKSFFSASVVMTENNVTLKAKTIEASEDVSSARVLTIYYDGPYKYEAEEIKDDPDDEDDEVI